MNREKAKEIADDTLKVLKAGSYTYKTSPAAGGIIYDALHETITKCINNTVTINSNIGSISYAYPTMSGSGLMGNIVFKKRKENSNTKIKVTEESVLDAARRLNHLYPCVLNFANATSPGGGFLRGAIAQEETICRSSALYLAIKDSHYYDYHKGQANTRAKILLKGTPLSTEVSNSGLTYSDTTIYSPDVPVFKNDEGQYMPLQKTCFLTSPAPMRGSLENMFDPDPDDLDDILEPIIERRIGRILDVMATFNHKTIILGGWGCGAFSNDPWMVADTFKRKIAKNGNFDRVLFPMYGDKDNYKIFKEVFDEG